MTTARSSFRPSKLSDAELAAARRLKAAFEASGAKQREFGEAHKIGTPGMVSQYINGKRPMSLAVALKFARGLDVPLTSISPELDDQRKRLLSDDDDPPVRATSPALAEPAADSAVTISQHQAAAQPYDGVLINQFDTGGKMGHGLVLRDQPGIIRSWQVSEEWVQKNVHSVTSVKNLAIVTGFGDSMRPLYNPGDPLLVDTGVRTVDFDGIYFFRISDEGFVKRLQRIPGQGVRVISDNKAYDPWHITDGMDFEVFARVVKVWRGDDF